MNYNLTNNKWIISIIILLLCCSIVLLTSCTNPDTITFNKTTDCITNPQGDIVCAYSPNSTIMQEWRENVNQ